MTSLASLLEKSSTETILDVDKLLSRDSPLQKGESEPQQVLSDVIGLSLLLPEERERLLKLQGELERMRLEAESLSHQRAVVEVLSRPVVNKVLHGTRGGRFAAYGRTAPSSLPSAKPAALNKGHDFGEIGVDVRDAGSPIYIPPYNQSQKAGARQRTGGNAGTQVLARGTAGRAVLPSAAPLSAETQRIATQPQLLVPRRTRRRAAPKTSAQPPQSRADLFPLVSSLQQTRGEVQRLRAYVDQATARMQKQSSRSWRKMRMLGDALLEQGQGRDLALLSEVDALVQGVLQAWHAEGLDREQEAEALDLLADVLACTPLFEVEEELPGDDLECREPAHRDSSPPPVFRAPAPALAVRREMGVQAEQPPEEKPQAEQLEEQKLETEVPSPPLPAAAAAAAAAPAAPAPVQVIVQLPPEAFPRDEGARAAEQRLLQLAEGLLGLGGKAWADQQQVVSTLLDLLSAPPPAPPALTADDGVSLKEEEEGAQPAEPVSRAAQEDREVQTEPPPPAEQQEKEEREAAGKAASLYATSMGEALLGGRCLRAPYLVTPTPPLRDDPQATGIGGRRVASARLLHGIAEASKRRGGDAGRPDEGLQDGEEKEGGRLLSLAERFVDALCLRPAPQTPLPSSDAVTKAELRNAVQGAVGRALQYVAAQPQPPRNEKEKEKPRRSGAVAGGSGGLHAIEGHTDELEEVAREAQRSRRQLLKLRQQRQRHKEVSGEMDSVEQDEAFQALYASPPSASRPCRDGAWSSSLSSSSSFVFSESSLSLAPLQRSYDAADPAVYSRSLAPPLVSSLLPQPCARLARDAAVRGARAVEVLGKTARRRGAAARSSSSNSDDLDEDAVHRSPREEVPSPSSSPSSSSPASSLAAASAARPPVPSRGARRSALLSLNSKLRTSGPALSASSSSSSSTSSSFSSSSAGSQAASSLALSLAGVAMVSSAEADREGSAYPPREQRRDLAMSPASLSSSGSAVRPPAIPLLHVHPHRRPAGQAGQWK